MALDSHDSNIALEGLSVEDTQQLMASGEKHEFQAEVTRLMKLIINSLYKNKDIFLRELISNAADALDKVRFLSLKDASILGDYPEMEIRIIADKKNGVLHISDTGIGMTRDHLLSNLGTIARSGTAEFMSALAAGDAGSLIGQFGVGFYSAFLVADTVVVTSKHNDDEQYIWESDATSFKLSKDPRPSKLARGTRISLYLKEEAKDFLNQDTLEGLIRRYSQFVNFPIYLHRSHIVEKTVPVEKEPKADAGEEDDDVAVADEGDDEPKTKVIEVEEAGYDQMNTLKPIWQREPKDVDDKEYNEFFTQVFRQGDRTLDPMAHIHFKAEGEISFKALLYVPTMPPANLLLEYGRRHANIKLYVRRVFITDDLGSEFFPHYLSFVSGVVDSDDIPLNVSRETLQQSKLLKIISKKIVRKCIEMFRKLQEDDKNYLEFWNKYGTFMKMGVIEDDVNRSRLATLLRFRSSKDQDADESTIDFVGFDHYLDRMKEGQDVIYYLPGQSLKEVQMSPLAERLIKKGYEVLYFVDPLDEYIMQGMPEYKGKKFANVAKDGITFGNDTKKKQEMREYLEKKFKPLTLFLKKVLDKQLDKAVISDRLSESPCAIVAQEWAMTGTMQRIARNQAATKDMAAYYTNQRTILEINPRHPVIKKLLDLVEDLEEDEESAVASDLAYIMFDIARVRSGYDLEDTSNFSAKIERLMRRSVGVDVDEKVEAEDPVLEVGDEEAEEEIASNESAEQEQHMEL